MIILDYLDSLSADKFFAALVVFCILWILLLDRV